MLATRFTELVGCTTPIQLAGMGAVATPGLAAAVSNAGGLGMLGTARPGLNISTLDKILGQLRDFTSRPFGVNFIVEPCVLGGVLAFLGGAASGAAVLHRRRRGVRG